MSEPQIRRRSLPDSLRYLARKLDEPLTDAERAGVALTLNSLADEADAFAHELAERIRNTPSTDDPDDYGGFVDMGADWAADLIDPSAGPVRPDEERDT